jgi:hypothetical protein
MNTRWIALRIGFCCGLGVALVAGRLTRSADATPPWQFISFKKIDADPTKSYPLTQANGPWVIVATTFHGDQAEPRARQLVYELRQSYKLNAYTHARNYDYTQRGMGGIGFYPDGTPKRMKYQNEEKYEEVAVLVGDFHSVDDPEGQKTLAMLKKAEPDCLKTPDPQAKADNKFAELFRFQTLTRSVRKAGPMGDAFMTTNPLLPKEYFAPKGVDKMTLEMNRGVQHSLLDCQGRYTVRIATFSGRVVIDQQKIRELEHGKDSVPITKGNDESPLVEAAKKAHLLTEALRAKGVEAYEFHDRYTSIVTIGSFNSVGTPRADGKTEINPMIYQIMQKYGADQSAGGQSMGCMPKTVMVGPEHSKQPVVLDIQPMPVEVPHRSISSDYQQASLR